jgi:isoleucyl-tRNA synthetase
MDWDDSYFTMSDENNYTIWHFLKTCHEKGWIYKGHDVMPWCPRCGTGISEHEIVTEGTRSALTSPSTSASPCSRSRMPRSWSGPPPPGPSPPT